MPKNYKIKKLKGIYNPINIIKTAIYRKKNKKAIFPYYRNRSIYGRIRRRQNNFSSKRGKRNTAKLPESNVY